MPRRDNVKVDLALLQQCGINSRPLIVLGIMLVVLVLVIAIVLVRVDFPFPFWMFAGFYAPPWTLRAVHESTPGLPQYVVHAADGFLDWPVEGTVSKDLSDLGSAQLMRAASAVLEVMKQFQGCRKQLLAPRRRKTGKLDAGH